MADQYRVRVARAICGRFRGPVQGSRGVREPMVITNHHEGRGRKKEKEREGERLAPQARGGQRAVILHRPSAAISATDSCALRRSQHDGCRGIREDGEGEGEREERAQPHLSVSAAAAATGSMTGL